MARFRISGPARGDLEQILATSLERWGEAGRAAMRAIARNPEGSATRERHEVSPGVRSLHVRHARGARGVRDPVHVVFYRLDSDVVEVVRVLHERMEPTLHLATRTSKRR
jgi:toxin ParE1/3/4